RVWNAPNSFVTKSFASPCIPISQTRKSIRRHGRYCRQASNLPSSASIDGNDQLSSRPRRQPYAGGYRNVAAHAVMRRSLTVRQQPLTLAANGVTPLPLLKSKLSRFARRSLSDLLRLPFQQLMSTMFD